MTRSHGATTELHGRRVTLRPAVDIDADALLAILAEPEVARWWPTFDRPRVLRELIAEREAEEGFVIELGGRIVGYIQAAEEVDPEFRHASIDLFLSSGSQGRGLGPDAIRALAADLIDSARSSPDHDRSRRGQQPGDRGVRQGRIPARRTATAVPAHGRWHLGRRAADGDAGRRAGPRRRMILSADSQGSVPIVRSSTASQPESEPPDVRAPHS